MNNTREQELLYQLIVEFMNKYKEEFENFSVENKIKMLLDNEKNYTHGLYSTLTNASDDEFSYQDFIRFLYTSKNNLYITLMNLDTNNSQDVEKIQNILSENMINIYYLLPEIAINKLFSNLNNTEFQLMFDPEMSQLLPSNIISTGSDEILSFGTSSYSTATVNFLKYYIPYMPESFRFDLKVLNSNLLN